MSKSRFGLFFLALASLGIAIDTLAIPTQLLIGLTRDQTCVSQFPHFDCWGNNNYDELDIPKNVLWAKQISGAASSFCVINQDDKIVCWGKDKQNSEQLIPDFVGKPTYLVSDPIGNRDCALSDIGEFKCWGRLADALMNSDLDFSKLKEIDFYFIACGIFEGKGVHCWKGGEYHPHMIPPNDIVDPYRIEVGPEYACVLAQSGIHCWGSKQTILGEYEKIKPDLDLMLIDDIVALEGFACAFSIEKNLCWGDRSDEETIKKIEAIEFGKVEKLYSHANRICALYRDQTIECFGDNRHYQNRVLRRIDKDAKVFASNYLTCLRDSKGLECQGFNFFDYGKGFNALPEEEKNPKIFGTSHTRICMLDTKEKVRCFSPREELVTDVFDDLTDIREIKGSDRHLCIKTKTELYCYIRPASKPYFSLAFKESSVSSFTLKATSICFIKDSGEVQCKLTTDPNLAAPKDLKGVIKLASAIRLNCALLQSGEVRCWGSGAVTNYKFDRPATHIWTVGRHFCVYYGERPKCFDLGGNQNKRLEGPSNLKNPRNFQGANHHTCAETDDGPRCWGENNFGQVYRPTKLNLAQ